RARGGPGSGGAGRRRGSRRVAALAVIDEVFLGHAAIAAGAADLGRVDVLFGGYTAAGGRQLRLVRAGRGWRGCRGTGWRGRFGLVGLGLGLCRRSGRGAFLDGSDDLFTVDDVTDLVRDGFQHAVDGRGHFEHDLVGFQVHQVLVALDGIAHLLVPAGDGGIGHGLG